MTWAGRVTVYLGLGSAWYCILLLPPFTRSVLTGDPRLLGNDPRVVFVTMLVSSALISFFLLRVNGLESRLARTIIGLLVPIAGAPLFFLLYMLWSWLEGGAAFMGGSPDAGFTEMCANLGLSLVSGFIFVTVAYLQSWYVAIPMGLIHVRVLSFCKLRLGTRQAAAGS